MLVCVGGNGYDMIRCMKWADGVYVSRLCTSKSERREGSMQDEQYEEKERDSFGGRCGAPFWVRSWVSRKDGYVAEAGRWKKERGGEETNMQTSTLHSSGRAGERWVGPQGVKGNSDGDDIQPLQAAPLSLLTLPHRCVIVCHLRFLHKHTLIEMDKESTQQECSEEAWAPMVQGNHGCGQTTNTQGSA